MRGRVAVVGSYNLGITYRVSRLPVWGETLAGQSARFDHGGKGSNQAVASARFGAPTSFVGCVGQDPAGHSARALLADEGVDIGSLETLEGYATGVGSIFVDAAGENAIVIDLGANAQLTPQALASRRQTPWRTADVVLAQLEVPWDTIELAFRESEGLAILNPAPAHHGLATVDFRDVDLLTPNATEARLLTGMDADAAVSDRDLLHRLLERTRVPRIVLTLGSAGSLVWDGEQAWRVPALPVQAVDTTGAGDVFNGVLAAALAQGTPLLSAVRAASAAASLSVGIEGVIPAIPPADLVHRRALEIKPEPTSLD